MYTILIFVSVLLCFYLYFTKRANYWKERNVPFIKPMPIFGNFYKLLSVKKGIGFFLADLYNEMTDYPFFGIWVFHKPHLIVKSPDLIKSILATDFDVFSDRNVFSDHNIDPYVANMLFFQKNPEWKRVRKQMSPAFTSGKLKAMMPLMNESARDMIDYVKNEINAGNIIESKDLFTQFMVTIIASCVFGIEVKIFEDPNNEFYAVTSEMFKSDLSNTLRSLSHFFMHFIPKYLRISFVKPQITKFLTKVFSETIKHRENANIKRHDFVEMLLQHKELESKNGNGNADIKVIAEAMQFYLAGFETTSTTMSFTLYEICINENYQKKLRHDVLSNIEKHGGITYEAIMDMKYLDNCISEVLRKYPVLPFLDRFTSKDYQLPGTNNVIEKGTPIFIPIFGLHYDPKYFPDPEKFDPDRFTEENSKDRHHFCYLPFGEGPRNCIGARFGLLASKLGLVYIIANFELFKCNETPIPIVFDPKTLLLQSTVGLPMKMKEYNAVK